MEQRDLKFYLIKRRAYNAIEYALRAQIDQYPGWVIYQWSKKPSDKEIEKVKTIFIRGMEFQHRHTKLPEFNYSVKDVEDTIHYTE